MNQYFDNLATSWDNDPAKVQRACTTANKIKLLELQSYGSIIDFGSGTGLLGMQLSDLFSSVILADASSNMLDVAKQKVASANLSNISTLCVTRLSDIESTHSAIVTLMTLHHIEDTDQFFTEAYLKLEEGGALLIADLYSEDGSFHAHDTSFTGHNGFDIEQLSQQAVSSGFDLVSIEKIFDVIKGDTPYPLFLFAAQKRCESK